MEAIVIIKLPHPAICDVPGCTRQAEWVKARWGESGTETEWLCDKHYIEYSRAR